ncbi:GTP-binding protein rbg1 [Naganishia onofrii]|uniref:GTP-binding protein rbg1 n=1 Tax=Naganishia onofrii TaxID=1851511 RepID=A0ACC2XXC9_9TREE|nr:GTP-binding protein rbg1 [Naganishia onofrii]
MTTVQKIKAIEDEMSKTQKNKATSYHLGQLKAKLAKLRRELIEPRSGSGGGASLPAFEVAKTEFTTLTAIAGEINYNGAKIQIVDLPGIIEGAKDGKGRGKQVIAVARTCNLIFIVLDVLKPLNDLSILTNELEGFGIRLNKRPPNITVKRREKGGVQITNTVPLTNLDQDEIRAVMSEYKLSSASVAIHQPDATLEDLIDVIEGNRVYIPAIYVLNKIDAISIEELDLLYKIPHSVPISSKLWLNVDELTERMWEDLNLVRIYTRPKGKLPDYTAPVVLRRGKCSVEDFSIHKEITKQFKHAIVWGASAKHARGQKVGLEHILEDEDVICIYKK